MQQKVTNILCLVCTLCLTVGSVQADRLEDMISPVSNPVNFDDPRANTEARLVHMFHEIDSGFITGGGDIQVYALQLRYAVNERLALLATKDGYIDFNPDGVLTDDAGFANIAAGAKYAFYMDPDQGQIATAGLRYEIPLGEQEVFQGRGDGFIQPFLTGASALCDRTTLIAATGMRIPIDQDDSTFWDLDLHIDYRVGTQIGDLYPLLELNMVHVVDGGRRLAIADEGLDLISFGASEADGKTILSGAAGWRVRLSEKVDWGFAYQFPLTSGRGSELTKWRVTSDLIFSFDI